MKRVKADGDWSLMCPDECPGLHEVWGDEFEALYEKYEKEGRARKTVKAQKIWYHIIESQIETGTPYMLYKDACNRKSNQQNLGTIKCSNLCTEIVEYSAPDEVAVCNLASIAVNMFVKPDKTYDFAKLKMVSKVVTKNLNKIIDVNFYPVIEARNSNMRHRPVGIGIQGLADAYIMMRYPFESEEAVLLNKQIFETTNYDTFLNILSGMLRDMGGLNYEASIAGNIITAMEWFRPAVFCARGSPRSTQPLLSRSSTFIRACT